MALFFCTYARLTPGVGALKYRIGKFVEVKEKNVHAGLAGTIESINEKMATLKLEDGSRIETNVGNLVFAPNENRQRRYKRRFREQDIAKLKPLEGRRIGNIREYPATIFGPNPE